MKMPYFTFYGGRKQATLRYEGPERNHCEVAQRGRPIHVSRACFVGLVLFFMA